MGKGQIPVRHDVIPPPPPPPRLITDWQLCHHHCRKAWNSNYCSMNDWNSAWCQHWLIRLIALLCNGWIRFISFHFISFSCHISITALPGLVTVVGSITVIEKQQCHPAYLKITSIRRGAKILIMLWKKQQHWHYPEPSGRETDWSVVDSRSR